MERGDFSIRDEGGERWISLRRLKIAAKDDVSRGFMPLSEATEALGMTREQLLAFCEEHGVRTFKYRKRWLVHQRELLDALQRT